MTPQSLTDWTVEGLQTLLTSGVFEVDRFDFKEMLPPPRDRLGKERLVKTCAAFANSSGGFLVYGVKDGRGLPAEERLVGVIPTVDFPEHFGNGPAACYPPVSWELRNPPLPLSNGNVVHVVHIPRSWRAPHAVGSAKDGWRFPKRTNKGTEFMDFSEVQQRMLGLYEKRLLLQLLQSELHRLDADVSAMRKTLATPGKLVVNTLDVGVTERVVVDTYSVLMETPALLTALHAIRAHTHAINTAINYALVISATALSSGPITVASMQSQVYARLPALSENISIALRALTTIWAPPAVT